MTPEPIEQAREAARDAQKAQRRADAARHARDEAIRAALAAGNTQALVAKVTDLTRSAIRKIAGQGEDK